MDKDVCGTAAGYWRHYRQGPVTCVECRRAFNDVRKEKYLKNPDKAKENAKKYRENNPEKAAESKRNSYLKNRDYYLEMFRKYGKNNPEESREGKRRRRAKVRENGFNKYTEEQVFEMWGTDCHICLEPIDLTVSGYTGATNWEKGLHIDHVIPISKGGSDTLDNVKPAHAICNLRKNARELNGVSDV